MQLLTTPNNGRPFLEELPSSTGSAMIATAGKTFMENPTPALTRVIGDFLVNKTSDDPLVAKSELTTKLKELDLDLEIPEQGMTQKQFDNLVKIQQTENRYNAVISRAPNTFLSNAALFGTSFAASALDPIGAGSALIPVYGEAKFTAMLANATKPLTRAAIRARSGFRQGAIGAAYLEPLNLGLSEYEQRDYNLTNSLENIIFGGAFGAGLHAGIGALSDSFRKNNTIAMPETTGINATIYNGINPEVRNTAARIAVTQVLNGYYPNVESVLKFDPNYRLLNDHFNNIVIKNPDNKLNALAPDKPFDPFEKPVPNVVILKSFIPEDIKPTKVDPNQINPQTFAASVTGTGESRFFVTSKEAEKVQSAVFRRSGDILAIKQTDDGRFILLKEFGDMPYRDGKGSVLAFPNERAAIKASKSITDLKDRNLTAVPFVHEGKLQYALFENADPGFVASAKKNPEFVQFNLNKANTKQSLPLQEPNEQQLAAVQRAAQEQINIKQMRLADLETVDLADRIYNEMQSMDDVSIDLPRAMKKAADFEALIRADAKNTGREADLDELKVYDDLIKDADNYAKAIESAFNCSIRKGL